MQYFPIFLDLRGQKVVVSGAGETAEAKLRLLLKTDAKIFVFGESPTPQIKRWADQGQLSLIPQVLQPADLAGAKLVYCANNNEGEDTRAAKVGRRAGAQVNIVDNLEDSDFLTPAIVDRAPVTVAIGTEGAAPVLARQIKALNEENLSPETGTLARIARDYRAKASALSERARREFWAQYYKVTGPRAFKEGGEAAVPGALDALLTQFTEQSDQPGHVSIVGAGPGDPELLTLKARKAIHEADVVIYDRLVSDEILELARREAALIEVGKTPHGPSWSQDDINALVVEHASAGAHVVRLKSGDPAVYGRLDEEMDALDAADIAFDITPGVTSAAAGAAEIKVSLTRRGRNSSFQLATGHDVDGFAEQDWRRLAQPGATAAIYMGVRAARFIQGRLLLHGAAAETPVAVIENISRQNQKTVSATLADLPQTIERAGITGPAILFLGLAPRQQALAGAVGENLIAGAL